MWIRFRTNWIWTFLFAPYHMGNSYIMLIISRDWPQFISGYKYQFLSGLVANSVNPSSSNIESDAITPYHFSNALKHNIIVIQFINNIQKSDSELLDLALGGKSYGHVFGVSCINDIGCLASKSNSKPFESLLKVKELFANAYYMQMNLSYLNTSAMACNGTDLKLQSKLTYGHGHPTHIKTSLHSNRNRLIRKWAEWNFE